ncbi:MAG TPA: hypothetical protein VGO50_04335 [Pyrinomonadaceae bacterium]|jgi:hypothetical protein|nr:hypothetical protein [Pyrinomonadaceae bacterium]
MIRYVLNIAAALLTFTASLLITFQFYSKPVDRILIDQPPATEESEWVAYFPIAETPTESSAKNDLPKKPFCHDKKILPVWDELKRDKEFQGRTEFTDGTSDCAGMFEYKAVDLNKDGQEEIMLRGKTVSFCGGVGNCMMWIFEKKSGRYRTLLATTDYVDASEMGSQIRKTRTNGYSDLLLKGHIDAGNTHHVYFNFDGKKYRQGKCLVDAYFPGSSLEPEWRLIACAEFEKYYYNR